MALYSTDIRTRDLDPTTNIAGVKVEFKLPDDAAYYPNFRLANVGATQTGLHHYNPSAGAYSVIRHIRLVSKGVELDSMRFANRYLSFANLNNKNEDNRSVNKCLTRNSLGYTEQPTRHKINTVREFKIAQNFDESALGHLDLRKCLPLLENISMLPTSIFKSLKVIIEFESDTRIISVANNNPATPTTPILLVDEIVNPARVEMMMKDYSGAVFNKWEHDQVSVPAIANPAGAADTTAQDLSFRLNAFDDKFVSRILFTKALTDKSKYLDGNTVIGLADLGSVAVHRERWNLKLNGALVYPQNLDRESTRAALLHDAFGVVNYIPYGDREAVGLDRPDAASDNNKSVPLLNGTRQGNLVGSMSFVGMSLNEKVEQLEVSFGRTAVRSTGPITGHGAKLPDQDALDIHAYAEVRKAVSVAKDGSFQVSYL